MTDLDQLRAQLAEAQAEIERLRADVAGSDAAKIVWFEDCMRTKQQLAASQATNEKLREALKTCHGYDEDYGAYHVQEFNGEKVVAALALPNDTTTLNKLLAGVYEECAKECDRLDYWYSARAIRALAKQKGITS